MSKQRKKDLKKKFLIESRLRYTEYWQPSPLDRKLANLMRKDYDLAYIPFTLENIEPSLKGIRYNIWDGDQKNSILTFNYLRKIIKGKINTIELGKIYKEARIEFRNFNTLLKSEEDNIFYEEERNSWKYFTNKVKPILNKQILEDKLTAKHVIKRKPIKI